jgi:hypothetical protein
MVRRILLVLLAVTPVAAVATVAGASHGGFHADLRGFDEVPAISTTGTGSLIAFVGDQGGQPVIRYRLEYSGLEGVAQAAHIHLGQPDVNGGVIAFLCGGGDKPACPPSGVVRGTIDGADIVGPTGQGITTGEMDEVLAAMEAGVVYANVHSDIFPGGEIRGQLFTD